MTVHKYGLKRDIPDPRDIKYCAPRRLISLPLRVDLRPYESPVEDQGSLGSCTGQAFAAALEYLDRKDDGAHADVSRLFIYYNERMIEGTINEDAGAYIRDGIKALKEWGACDEHLWPYSTSRFAVQPSPLAYRDALKRRIPAYYRVMSLYDLKAAIAEGYAVVFGIRVFESFESAAVTRTGIVPMPGRNERELGGHALKAAGYDDVDRWVFAKNSYGEDHGDKGYLKIPYDYIGNPELAWDFWAIRGDGMAFNQAEPEIQFPADTVVYIPAISIFVRIWNWLKGRKA